MTYNQILQIAQKGKTIMLPNFTGYFKWNYSTKTLMFENKDFKCSADKLNIADRTDFYYII